MMKNTLQILLVYLPILFTTNVLGQTTSVMSFNIRYDTPKDGDNRWDKRKEAVVDLINYYQPSFLGIQEGLHRQVQFLDNSLSNYEYVGIGRDDGKTKGEFSAIFYDKNQFSVVKQATFWLSEQPNIVSVGWDASMERICSYALFQHLATGEKMWVFNAHFDHKGVVAREMSSKLIIAKINELNSDGFPVVLMGDFNSAPDSHAMMTIASKLDDSFTMSTKKHYGPVGTFNGFDPLIVLDRRIDYIFVQNIKVISHAHIDDKRPDGHYVSDHLPVLAVFAF